MWCYGKGRSRADIPRWLRQAGMARCLLTSHSNGGWGGIRASKPRFTTKQGLRDVVALSHSS